MKTVRGTTPIELTREEFDWINLALGVEFCDYDDEWLRDRNLLRDDCRGIYAVSFEDGYEITFDLYSGDNNYWDEWNLHDSDYNHIWNFDPSFEIDSGEMEFYLPKTDTTYIVEIVIREENGNK